MVFWSVCLFKLLIPRKLNAVERRNQSLYESQSCSVLTVCGAQVGREKVSTQVIPLRVGLATLRLCILVFEQLVGRSA